MLTLLQIISCFLLGISLADAATYKVCVGPSAEGACQKMQDATKVMSTNLVCVFARDKIDCMRKIQNGEADVVNLAANEAYIAAMNFSLNAVFQEERDNKNDGIMYESVAVIKKSSGIKSLKDLKQKRSCHTGYGRNAGWSIPISILRAASDVMDPECDELSAVSKFFSKSCAPGSWSTDQNLDKVLKSTHKNLCELCASKCENPKDEYLGYEGALKCLINTEADVAFTKYVVAKEFFVSRADKNDYEYLCGNGTRVPIDSNCFWASRPNNFIMTRSNMPDVELASLKNDIVKIFTQFQTEKPDWLYNTLISSSNITSLSEQRSSIVDRLADYNYRITIDKVLPKSCIEKYVRFCVTSKLEFEKCQDFKLAAYAQRLRPQVECHQEESDRECWEAIRDGKADVMAGDSGHVYEAHKNFNLIPIMSEIYGAVSSSYYAVAVVRSDSDVSKVENLKGRKSCHTGFRRTAGWNVPVGTLKRKGLIGGDACSIQDDVGKFFMAGCVPGIQGVASLCKVCIGDDNGNKICEASSEERYYGYSGALRCLAEKAGEVAFVKHTTVDENIGVPNPPSWAKGLKTANFSLLCSDGRRSVIDNFRDCNWAQVASHKLITSGTKTSDEILSIKLMLLKASDSFGQSKELFKLFGPYKNGKDLLFKDSATSLQAVPEDATVETVLGEDLYQDLEATYCSSSSVTLQVSLLSLFTSILIVFTRKM